MWVADDTATKDLMQDFYLQLRNGQSKDKALQLAKLSLMNSGGARAHPFFWAGFIPVGDMAVLKE